MAETYLRAQGMLHIFSLYILCFFVLNDKKEP